MTHPTLLKVALAQIARVWLNKQLTIQKIEHAIEEAAKENAAKRSRANASKGFDARDSMS